MIQTIPYFSHVLTFHCRISVSISTVVKRGPQHACFYCYSIAIAVCGQHIHLTTCTITISGTSQRKAETCCPCGGSGCSPCRPSLVCRVLACILLCVHAGFAGIGVGVIISELIDGEIGLVPDLVLYSLAFIGSFVAVIAGCFASCMQTSRSVSYPTQVAVQSRQC